MTPVVLSLYIAYALYEVVPFKDSLFALGGTPAMHTIVAIIFYAVLVAVSSYLLRRLGYHGHSVRGLPLALLTLITIGFLLALAYNLFAITHLIVFPTLVAQLFAPSSYFFYWFIAPLVALFLLAR